MSLQYRFIPRAAACCCSSDYSQNARDPSVPTAQRLKPYDPCLFCGAPDSLYSCVLVVVRSCSHDPEHASVPANAPNRHDDVRDAVHPCGSHRPSSSARHANCSSGGAMTRASCRYHQRSHPCPFRRVRSCLLRGRLLEWRLRRRWVARLLRPFRGCWGA